MCPLFKIQNKKQETRNQKLSTILCLLVIFITTTQVIALEKVYNFDKDTEGFPPEGFVIETGPGGKALVHVLRDPEAPTPPHLLSLQGSSFPGDLSLMCLAWFSELKNGEVSVHLRFGEESAIDGIAGLVWRYQSPTEHYSIELDARKSRISLVLIKNGNREILKKEEAKLPPNTWGILRIKFKEHEIQCEMNDKLILSAQNSDLTNSGKVGIFLKSAQIISFDNFHIKGND